MTRLPAGKLKRILFTLLLASDEVAAVVILLLILPRFGIEVPLVYTVLITVVLVAISAGTYVWLAPVETQKFRGLDIMMGLKGETLAPLEPYGQIRVAGEIWSAKALDGNIPQGARIIVERAEGLRLLVRKLEVQ